MSSDDIVSLIRQALDGDLGSCRSSLQKLDVELEKLRVEADSI